MCAFLRVFFSLNTGVWVERFENNETSLVSSRSLFLSCDNKFLIYSVARLRCVLCVCMYLRYTRVSHCAVVGA